MAELAQLVHTHVLAIKTPDSFSCGTSAQTISFPQIGHRFSSEVLVFITSGLSKPLSNTNLVSPATGTFLMSP
jgi:hypothetical protein